MTNVKEQIRKLAETLPENAMRTGTLTKPASTSGTTPGDTLMG